MHAIEERAARPEVGAHGAIVPVRVLADDGHQAEVQVEGCGVLLRQGAVHTVPSSALQRAH
ncbi:hypothetical protein JL475_24400 [Streptomyces sp. M2CJ-2]|uniref:hypothetical protein n=1 Tax=Streptomyces sp. M2CJ-2 TaxID=2803948 RepID=UPI00192724D5|nr:hypothetical protein [Streptomyces sp. M2CJ-2]MBL3669077.1 hypothetical protein [Streptomyces sp. M2CJ-2]